MTPVTFICRATSGNPDEESNRFAHFPGYDAESTTDQAIVQSNDHDHVFRLFNNVLVADQP